MDRFDDPALEFWRRRCEFWQQARADALRAAEVAEENFWADYTKLMDLIQETLRDENDHNTENKNRRNTL